MAEQSNVIRDRIQETKGEIGQDLATLESQIRRTVETTLDSVKDGLQKITPSHQIQQFPLLTLGGSLVAGAALGGWLASRGSSSSSFQGASFETPVDKPEVKAPALPGRFDEEFQLIKGVVLGTLARSAGNWLKQAVPSISSQVDEVVGRIATKIEGKKVHKAEMGEGESAKEWAPAATETPTPDGEPKSYH